MLTPATDLQRFNNTYTDFADSLSTFFTPFNLSRSYEHISLVPTFRYTSLPTKTDMFLSNAGNMSLGAGNNNNNANGGGGNIGAGLGFGMNNNGNQMHGNMSNGVQSQETGSSQPNSEYTLAGILHHLQSEWRRYEKDRNEWEIERAEMRARIALLEGERRGVENLKTDLMRRVKMLEYALRQERSKYLSSNANTASSPLTSNTPQVKNPLLQGLDKAASSSGRSSPAPFAESAATASTIAAAGSGSVNASALSTGLLSRSTSSAKDPKSRAKSREYLKQCLQEISYLTSATTLNPLPDRGIASGSSNTGGNNMQSALRPRKTMLESVPPTLSAPTTESHAAMAGSISRASAATALGVPNKGGRPGRSPLFASEPVVEESAGESEDAAVDPFQSAQGQQQDNVAEQRGSDASTASESVQLKNPLSATFAEPEPPSHSTSTEASEDQEQDQAPGSSNSSDSSRSSQSTDSLGTSVGSQTDQEFDDQDQVTAIFKPGGNDWQKLKEAGIQNRSVVKTSDKVKLLKKHHLSRKRNSSLPSHQKRSINS